MKKYHKFQFAWMIVFIFLIVTASVIFSYIYQWGNHPIGKEGLIILLVLFGGLLLGFYGMTVIVTDTQIKIKFGIGIFTKRIDLASISSISVTKYPVYYGYGIRVIPNGMLYNVSGSHAIELILKGNSSVIQIGTNDWDKLKLILDEKIQKKNN